MTEYRRYNVSRHHREPLLDFVLKALEASGCTIIESSPPIEAPFRVTFQTPHGVRMGVLVYAFLANRKNTKNRPSDEWRFQVKYGPRTRELHELWEDPFGLYTTLFLGISPSEGFFVGADPVLNSPTRFYISKEFKDEHVHEIMEHGWAAWERERRLDGQAATEVMVGGTPNAFLRYILFEQEVLGEEQGIRQLVAERFRTGVPAGLVSWWMHPEMLAEPRPADVQALVRELALPEAEILRLIEQAPRLKMAVRGWVAERHLFGLLQDVPGVSDCEPLEVEGGADISLVYRGKGPLHVECKNVLRKPYADGVPKLDFQRTRAAQGNPCSRYYAPTDFQVVAACLHSVTEHWEYRGRATRSMDPHSKCEGKLHHGVRIDETWTPDFERVLHEAASA